MGKCLLSLKYVYTCMKHIKRWKQNRKGTNKREMMTYSRYVGNHIVSLKSLAFREFKLNA